MRLHKRRPFRFVAFLKIMTALPGAHKKQVGVKKGPKRDSCLSGRASSNAR